MKRQIILLFGFCLLLPGMANAQKKASQQKQNVIQVQDSATYAVGENEAITLCDARDKCILKARVNAIKNKFGERITVHEEELNENYFRQVLAECRADWLKDVGKPVLSASYQDGVLTFTAKVKGLIRESSATKIDIKYNLLTNGGRETNVFENEGSLFLKFKSPADGFLYVWLCDDAGKIATRLLPYVGGNQDGYRIRRNKEYIFFNPEENNGEDGTIQNCYMTLSSDLVEVEKNRVVIVFSSKPIPPCELVRDRKSEFEYARLETFTDWLYRCRIGDMNVFEESITIQKKNKEQ